MKKLFALLMLLVLAFSIVSMMQAQAAASVIGEIDTKIKSKTFFIKSLIIYTLFFILFFDFL